ncbi:NAD-dependent epimerase/dehydratase family protein [Litorilinea aerophila]|uniref:NAD-dependent epimerase/dehydratase family protein n=1 Tax=Litorilinea aerophila TaxID=1204385 RepID=A0A540V988_9CHLR|nr:NAD-dependent epimerase/dehydratase family protein [Litorilinea aerophila]MCC9078823.1 NAD-dependent epimerase/dehydratase family protein [Litorilinea aerophila]GIV75631.1 MAG: NAD-dependent epimerase [Litorilinea sp.]
MNYLDFYADKRILITGGLGFIGSNLARRLVDLGARVTLVDSLIPDYGGNLFNIAGYEERLRVNIADVRDPYSMRALVKGQDLLFNLAGQVSHLDSMLDPFTDLEINARSQLSILEACRHENPAIKVIYAGTRQQYGKPQYLPLDEEHRQQPTDVNGVNKLAGEWYHIVYHRAYDLRTASLRLTNTYGPRQLMKHNRQGFIAWFVRLAVEGREIPIYGDGQQLRDLCYVDDVVDAFLRAGASEAVNGRVFNLGGQEPVSLLDLARLIIEIAGRGSIRLVPWPEDRRRIDIGDVYSSYARIQETLGWQPTTDLRTGLTRMIQYYQEHWRHYW